MNRKLRVLIVDDSATVRQTLSQVLSSDPEIEVMATASDPYVAVRHMQQEMPDVITLDIEMPRLDGLSFLEKIMRQHPLPVVICSTLTTAGSETALAALEKGAVEVIAKPKLGTKEFLEESRVSICEAVRAAAKVDLQKLRARAQRAPAAKLSADVLLAKNRQTAMLETTEKVVVVGASTGGTEALATLLSALPADAPGVVVVQHMPEGYTAQFARRLDGMCAVAVKEASDGDSVLRGHALIARGGHHLLIRRSGARYFVQVKVGPLVNRHRPSVDVLFRSAASCVGRNAVGVILTGMGDDGARGMQELKEAGALNFAQDEQSCVVFGMPKEAIRLGGVDRVLPLQEIAPQVLRACGAR
jgi:two-component system chemotaxis response regulator CheB